MAVEVCVRLTLSDLAAGAPAPKTASKVNERELRYWLDVSAVVSNTHEFLNSRQYIVLYSKKNVLL